MKIIEEKPFAYEFTCAKCGSKLVAEAEDVDYDEFGSCLSDYRWQYFVTCPVCNTYHFLKYGDVTPKVQALAQKKGRRR